MRQLTGRDDIGDPVAVHVGDRHVLGRTRLLPSRQRHELPAVRVSRPEGYPDVAVSDPVVGRVGLVH